MSLDSRCLRRRFEPESNGESGERNFSSNPRPSSGIRIGGSFLAKKALEELFSFFRLGRGGTGGGVSHGIRMCTGDRERVLNFAAGVLHSGRKESEGVAGCVLFATDTESVRRCFRLGDVTTGV